VAAILLIVGIRRLSSPPTARSGNWIARRGMTIAIVFTFLDPDITSYWLIVERHGGRDRDRRRLGPPREDDRNSADGGALQRRRRRSGGAHRRGRVPSARAGAGHLSGDSIGAMLFSALIGSISFCGQPRRLRQAAGGPAGPADHLRGTAARERHPLRRAARLGIAAGTTEQGIWMVLLLLGALLFGVLLVLPIGGADMPVVISLLNAFTGLAAASAGFVLDNTALIIGGTLVGASGTLLTILMGRAMNRSIANVLFGAFGAGAGRRRCCRRRDDDGRSYREVTADDAAVMLAYAQRVVVVPGYGLAVAQAPARGARARRPPRGARRGRQVRDPSGGGRMPGHMNVLLAEAQVPYPSCTTWTTSTRSSRARTSRSSSARTTSRIPLHATTRRARSTACRS
jgi:NAD(P) transhydrogenase subunit beta